MNIFQRVTKGFRDLWQNVKTIAGIVPTWEEGQSEPPDIKFDTIVAEGWQRNELIFACINKTANTAAQVSLTTNNPDLKRLIQQPNPFMSQFDFWFSILAYQKLTGWAVFEKERSATGQVVALWPLLPHWVKELKSSTKVIAGYKYGPNDYDAAFLPPEDVLVFRVFDPRGIYFHYPPVAVAARVGTVDNSTTDYLQQFFQQGGVPPGILKTKVKLKDATAADLRRRWGERYGGWRNWAEPAVLDMDAEYQQVGLDFQKMGFDVLDARNEARICMVLDVPPIMISANIGLLRSTFSNYREARLAWWQDSLLPIYSNLEDTLITGFQDDFPGAKTEWDFSRVPALQEERSARWDRATAAFSVGAITLNEFCMEVGLPDKGKRGELFIRQLSYIEVPANDRAEIYEPPKPEPPAIPEPSPEEETDEDEDEEPPEEGEETEMSLKAFIDQQGREQMEARIQGVMEKFLKGQRDRIAEEVLS